MWEMIDKKWILDFDGFWTEYSLWHNGEIFVCIFGDTELYRPEDESNWDFETDSEVEAYYWFSNYSTEE